MQILPKQPKIYSQHHPLLPILKLVKCFLYQKKKMLQPWKHKLLSFILCIGKSIMIVLHNLRVWDRIVEQQQQKAA